MSRFLIYTLVDGNSRYVRYSTCGLKRPQQHWKYVQSGKIDRLFNLKVYRWLRTLVSEPEIIVLQEYETFEELLSAEVHWIAALHAEGFNLMNMTDGGDGTAGHKFTDDQCAAISDRVTATWKDPEFRERNRLAQIKAQNRPEVRAKRLGDNNPSKRPEVRHKQSESLTGRAFSQTHIENIKASWTVERSEKMSKLKKRYWAARRNDFMRWEDDGGQ